MRGIPSSFLILFFVFVFLTEIISYFGVRILINRSPKKVRIFLSIFYFLVSVAATGLLLFAFSNPEVLRQSRNYTFFIFVISVTFLNLFPKIFFAFMTILSFLIRWLAGRRMQRITIAGSFLICSGIILAISYGILFGRFDLNVVKQDLYFDNLPPQADGLIIVQLSDIHLGSFGKNPAVLKETLKIIADIQPDLLFFTGDIVNNFADEMHGFEPYLKQFRAKYGKFAIQGNHDYGDYSSWPDSTSKIQNLTRIRQGFTRAGFTLLLNQSAKVNIQDTSIYILGVENWGHPPFPQYARLDLALDSLPSGTFKILLSHDPAHWNARVVPETDIPLTLSGHTHGGQFGIKIAGIEFSPIYFSQKNWGGLYRNGIQYLYVNKGLGTIGYPGRIDMRPEITVLTLHRIKNH